MTTTRFLHHHKTKLTKTYNRNSRNQRCVALTKTVIFIYFDVNYDLKQTLGQHKNGSKVCSLNTRCRQNAILTVDTSTQKDFHRPQNFDNRCQTRFFVLTLSCFSRSYVWFACWPPVHESFILKLLLVRFHSTQNRVIIENWENQKNFCTCAVKSRPCYGPLNLKGQLLSFPARMINLREKRNILLTSFSRSVCKLQILVLSRSFMACALRAIGPYKKPWSLTYSTVGPGT